MRLDLVLSPEEATRGVVALETIAAVAGRIADALERHQTAAAPPAASPPAPSDQLFARNDAEELQRLGAIYLGDAVYAWREANGTVVLATSNGRSRSNTIYLEPEVLGKFDAFRLKRPEAP